MIKTPEFETIRSRHLSKEDSEAVQEILDEEMAGNRLGTRDARLALIRRSRPKSSPTHHLFEWDVKKQQAEYLLARAGEIIRSVVVVFAELPEVPVRRYHTVVVSGKRGPYPIEKIRGAPEMMQAVLEDAKLDLESWRRRYETLRKHAELSGVFVAINSMGKKRQ
jgi:hypothetical protein